MKIKLIWIGKTKDDFVQNGADEYVKRLSRFAQLEIICIPDLKNAKKLNPSEIKQKEGHLILQKTSSNPIILLDEKGKQFTSVEFASYLQKFQSNSIKEIQFIIGGAYGFSKEVYQRATAKLSISKMTFSHQLIRPIFLEQLYRAYTIINNHPYHNE